MATPRTYAPGARVEIRGEEWLVRSTAKSSMFGSDLAVQVVGLSELVRGKEAVFLTELDTVRELEPEETALVSDPSPGFRRARLYIESLLRKTPPSDDALYIGHTAAVRDTAYQRVPAAKALRQPRPRILIADAVGLGKTIEAGILLAELIRRGRGRRILVVALKSILAQFQQELWARFTIPLVRLDSAGIERMSARIPAGRNPFHVYDRVIISIDTLKKDSRYRRYLESTHWDVVVIDECQNVALRGAGGSQRRRLATLLGRTTDALILTSATPHDGRPQSFASLMNLLEPTAVANPDDYTHEDIQGLYVRRFKKDVAKETRDAFHERSLTLERVETDPAEEAVFQAIQDLDLEGDRNKNRGGQALFRTTLLKAALSSPAACAETAAARVKKLPEGATDRTPLTQLINACAQVTAHAKVERLFALLDDWGHAAGKGDRVVVFSERIETLNRLQAALHARYGYGEGEVELFTGSQSDTEQQDLVKRFGAKKGGIRVLLASDAAAEGINLHYHCHRLVHFDIPWSLITLEQRNGRIDRFGQTRTPDIRYLLTLPQDPDLKGDLRIVERLIEKEDAAHTNLGDAAMLLNLHDPVAEAARVALGIERHEAPEDVVPDAAPLDPLMALFTAPPDQTREPPPRIVNPPTVFPDAAGAPDDLAYTRTALRELAVDDPDWLEPEWLESDPALRLCAPQDLRRRYALLPRGLRGGIKGDWYLNLTTDRDLVQKALAKARRRPGDWPEWELLWPLHPVAQWIDDRVLGRFARHEAPILRVARGLAPGERALIMQSVLSNKRSQPVLVDWFAVRLGAATTVQPFREFAHAVGLDQEMANAGVTVDPAPLRALIPQAVLAARAHVEARRAAREQELEAALAPERARVANWRVEALRALEDRKTQRLKRGALRDDEHLAFERERKEIEGRVEARERFFEEGMRTVPAPYLRVVAAVVGTDA